MNLVVPSVMCFDMLDMGAQVRRLDAAGVDQYHVDVMDGHYVANHALSADVVAALKRATDKPVDVHLMVTNPMDFIEPYAKAGADIIAMHLEMLDHPTRALRRVRALGKKAGLAISPATSLDSFHYLLDELDMVCVLTVDPGFAGQTLIPVTLEKIRQLRQMFTVAGKSIDILVDGQVKEDTAPAMVEAGANMLVVGYSGLLSRPGSEFDRLVAYYHNLPGKQAHPVAQTG